MNNKASPEEEKEYWSRHFAHGIGAVRQAIWDEPQPNSWHDRLKICLDAILPALDIKEGERVLDLGCGIGRLTLPVAKTYPSSTIIGVDISPQMIGRLKSEAEEHHIENVLGFVGNGRELPHEVGEIDSAYTMVCFQHLSLDVVGSYIENIARLLRPQGRIRFQFNEGKAQRQVLTHHYHHSRSNILSILEKSNFECETVETGIIYPEWTWITGCKR